MNMTNGAQSKRILWIDYCKVIGICLVLIGHTYPNNPITDWLYSFHMPLFFFISGLTLKKTGGWYIGK